MDALFFEEFICWYQLVLHFKRYREFGSDKSIEEEQKTRGLPRESWVEFNAKLLKIVDSCEIKTTRSSLIARVYTIRKEKQGHISPSQAIKYALKFFQDDTYDRAN